ncbi:hypothetical protein AVEN_237514-1, partial [Araneus ventricosus]
MGPLEKVGPSAVVPLARLLAGSDYGDEFQFNNFEKRFHFFGNLFRSHYIYLPKFLFAYNLKHVLAEFIIDLADKNDTFESFKKALDDNGAEFT